MDEINYTTPTEQIEKLRSQNMIILNEDFAKEQLQQCGYSNLIKSYRDPYTLVSNGRKIYRSGITFEQVLSLYTLDKNLRNAVMSAMLDLEEHIKEAAADVVHCNLFPEDITYLGQILNVNITISNNVWVTGRSKKYHRAKHCSGILNAKSIDVKAAETQGYTPCKKCCK